MPLELGVSLEESRMETGPCQQRGETQIERTDPDADGVERPCSLHVACNLRPARHLLEAAFDPAAKAGDALAGQCPIAAHRARLAPTENLVGVGAPILVI